MSEKSLSVELDRIMVLEDYHRLKLLYYKNLRHELERQIDTESTRILNEIDEVAQGAWDNDRP